VPDRPSWWPEQGDSPDYRFSLANERTLLAYTRTALAGVVTGTALVGTPLLTDGPPEIALVGIVPIVAGALVAAGARRRFLASERAMRTGEPLPPPVLAVRMSTAVALGALVGGPALGIGVWLASR
jgi:putative membrane protein